MALEDRGSVVCPFSGTSAAVRRNAKGRLYFNCPTCGVVQPHGAGFQSWMMDHATIYGPEGKPEAPITAPLPPVEVKTKAPPAAPVEKKPEEKPAPAVTAAPVTVEKKPEEKPAKKSALEGWTL